MTINNKIITNYFTKMFNQQQELLLESTNELRLHCFDGLSTSIVPAEVVSWYVGRRIS